MTSHPTNDLESADAEKVDVAIKAISAGNLDVAEQLLLAVIANAPADYTNSLDDHDGVSIKFWDQLAFIHYMTWQQDHGIEKGFIWIGNAYPRAHYYMGFLCVKRKQFDRAIEYLDKGHNLEPTNPKFSLEKALALVYTGCNDRALALYDQVTELGPNTSACDLAIARRGRGSVLIAMGRLDDAENAFRASLELEPENDVALNELRYIEHLRQGGVATHAEAVPRTDPNPLDCAVCGTRVTVGVIVSIHGMPVSICKRCEGKLTKKWWQFWKYGYKGYRPRSV